MPIKGYRFFDEIFEPGKVITPNGDHLEKLNPDKQRAEVAIRRGDPRGPSRAHAVFVFEKRDVAEALLGEASGHHLYETSVRQDDVFHRGDLRIYDEIVEALKYGRNADQLIAHFWDGIERSSPRVELTAARLTIRRKLASAETSRADL
jgi:hypothetical protein